MLGRIIGFGKTVKKELIYPNNIVKNPYDSIGVIVKNMEDLDIIQDRKNFR